MRLEIVNSDGTVEPVGGERWRYFVPGTAVWTVTRYVAYDTLGRQHRRGFNGEVLPADPGWTFGNALHFTRVGVWREVSQAEAEARAQHDQDSA